QYSCESCIKGHRQANCTHADRPLREIQKRGRPVTACAECRELRRATNSHRTCV
ncbi:Copper fist DNA binding domain-domain containing protein, partial [Rhodotorula toruloides]